MSLCVCLIVFVSSCVIPFVVMAPPSLPNNIHFMRSSSHIKRPMSPNRRYVDLFGNVTHSHAKTLAKKHLRTKRYGGNRTFQIA